MNCTRTTAGENRSKRSATRQRASALLVCLIFLIGGLVRAAAQTIPSATASSSSLLASINGNAGKISANTLGDVFYVSQGDNTAYWLPRGTTTPVALVTGLSGGRNVYVDSSNNVYVPSTYGGVIVEVPFVNGTYATKTAVGSVTACTSFSPSVPCTQGSAGANLSYYYQPLDVTMDAAGNLYAIDAYPNGTCTAGDCIVRFTRGTTTYNAPTVLVNTITAVDYNAQFNAAPNGDLYFANGKTLLYLAAGTTGAQSVGSFTNPTGVSTDTLGNVYVTNSSSPSLIYELPAVGGAAQLTKQFALLSTYSANTVALDGLGDLFYTGYSGGTNVNVATLNAINAGSSPVGTPATAPVSVTFTFGQSTTPTGITSTGTAFTYSAGSCAAGTTYAAGSSCTVNVSFNPTAATVQRGSVSLTSAAGTSLSTALLSGTGVGAAETNDPGTVTTLGSGLVSPLGLRADGAGNVFVADAGQNAVLRFPAAGGTPTSIGTGLSKPSSVTLDDAGNVFIADAGNGRVVEVPNINGVLTNSAQTVIASGLGSTLSIASGRFGNLYIADGSKSTITKLGSIGGTPSVSASTTIGSGFVLPTAIAVDRSGNVFVADYSTSLVSQINFYGKTQTTVGTGFAQPTGLVTDGAGSLYIADSGNSRILKLPLENGAFNTNDQYVVGSTVAKPYAVSIDSAGNLYALDRTALTVSQINRVNGTLALGRAQVNTTTAASNGYIGNSGTAALTLGTPAYTAVSTTPTYFSVTSPANGGCSNGLSLATGSACILSVTFSPTTIGTFSDLLTFTSNAVNGTPKTLNITGRGLNLSASTVTLTQTSPASGSPSFGQAVTIRATISSAVAGTPTGTVTFAVNGAPVSNPPTVVNGVATVTLSNLTGGTQVITATYSGDDNYSPSNGSLSITVLRAGSTTTAAFGSGLPTSPLSANPGQAVTITAVVVPGAATAPTGGVTFSAGSLVLNTTPVPLTAGNGGTYSATLTTTALPLGTNVVTATYSGDVNYAGSTGATVSILISYPTLLVTPSAATVTVMAGQTGTLAITATSIAGFASNTTYPAYVGFTCSGLPANSSCAFNPNNFLLQQGTPQAVTLQILTDQTPVISGPVVGASFGRVGGRLGWLMLLVALAPLGLLGRRRASGLLRSASLAATLALVFLATQVLTGCGSNLLGNTPAGTYQVKVTATSSPGGYAGGTLPSQLAAGCTTAVIQTQYNGPTTDLTCVQTTTVTLVVQ